MGGVAKSFVFDFGRLGIDGKLHTVPALIGGMLIGLASVWFMLANGRVAGISGIIGGLPRAGHADRAWRILFALGLILGPLAAASELAGSHLT